MKDFGVTVYILLASIAKYFPEKKMLVTYSGYNRFFAHIKNLYCGEDSVMKFIAEISKRVMR